MKKQKKNVQNSQKSVSNQAIPTSNNTGGSINPLWLSLALIFLTFIAYIGAFKNGFVEWDDQHYVTENLQVLNPTAENLKALLRQVVALNYHPLTMLSLAFNVLLFGKGAGSFIVTNVIIHVINTFLVFKFIQKLVPNKIVIAFLTALVFGLHPMHVESVAWIAERKDVLYTLFFLLSCISYLNYKEENSNKWLIFSILFFILSCLSKAMAVPLPIVLLLIDYWQDRNLFTAKTYIEKLPFFGIALLFGLISVNVQAGGNFHGLLVADTERELKALSTSTFSGLEKLSYPSFGYLKYHIMALLPTGLSNLHPYPAVSEPTNAKYFLSIAFFFASLGIMAWSFTKKKYIFFGWGFFFVTILLVLQFLSVGKAFMAERYTYIPYIGLFFMIFYGLDELLKGSKVLWGIGILFGLICFYLTTQQVKVWKDNFSLWSNAYKAYPNDDSILESMADEYGRRSEFDKVQEFAEKAIADGTDSYHTYEIMANVYGIKGDYVKSLEMYNKAISINGRVGNIYYNRGITLANTDPAKAIEDFDKALTLPSHGKVSNIKASRGFANLKLNKFKEAITDYTLAIEASEEPNGNFYMDRAIAKFYSGDKAGALADLQKSKEINPNNPKLQDNFKLMQGGN